MADATEVQRAVDAAIAAMQSPKGAAKLLGPVPTERAAGDLAEQIGRVYRRNVPKGFRWISNAVKLRGRIADLDAMERAFKLTREGPRSMVVVGPTSVGKTSLALACYREIATEAISLGKQLELDPGLRARRRRVVRMALRALVVPAFRLAKESMQSPLGRGAPPLIDEATTTPFLVIDDLGTDVEIYRGSSTALREILHERHAHQRATIVTTFLSREDLSQHYGDGIARRMLEWESLVIKRKG